MLNWWITLRLKVYLVIKMKYILQVSERYSFSNLWNYELEQGEQLHGYTNIQLTQHSFVPSEQSCFMPRHVRVAQTSLNCGFEYFGFGKVMWYQQNVSTQIYSKSSAYLRVLAWLKTKEYQTVILAYFRYVSTCPHLYCYCCYNY
jgi:hypothetical protein